MDSFSGMSKKEMNDCLVRIADGDGEAFRRLYEHFKNPIYRFALSIVKDRTLAEDAAQETFLCIRANAAQYQPRGKPKAWIYTIAHHCTVSELRRYRKDDCLENEKAEIPDKDWEDKALSTIHVFYLLSLLDEKERSIVTLHIYGGLKHWETAQVLHLSYEQVRWKYAYALKKLKKAIAAH